MNLSADQYRKTRNMLNATAKALINKKQIPQYAMGLLTDPACFHSAVLNYEKEVIKTYHCKSCGLDIKAPREWARAHHKKCSNRRTEPVKENETLSTRLDPFWY